MTAIKLPKYVISLVRGKSIILMVQFKEKVDNGDNIAKIFHFSRERTKYHIDGSG